jgi:hypothetical protein
MNEAEAVFMDGLRQRVDERRGLDALARTYGIEDPAVLTTHELQYEITTAAWMRGEEPPQWEE